MLLMLVCFLRECSKKIKKKNIWLKKEKKITRKKNK